MTAPAFAIPRQVALDAPRPPLHSLTEAELFRGMQVALDRRACACGLDVVLRPGERVEDVVTRHNQTVAHLAWRAQQEP